MTFSLDPTGYKYRGLKEGMSGWDVFALQTALTVDPDGVFGPVTKGAVEDYQKARKLTTDGIAGAVTQRELVLHGYVYPGQATNHTPPGLARGQIEAESSFWVGNHSSKYPNGTFDLGVAQQNSVPSDGSCRERFNVVKAISAYFARLVAYHDKYVNGSDEALTDRRCWELAAGAWNAPSWTDRLANGETLTTDQAAHITDYIQRVTIYVVWP